MITIPDNPLQALLLRAWSTDGFADTIAAQPHEALAAHGLAVGHDVRVTVFGWRSEPEHLCWDCQLAIPGVYVRLAPVGPQPPGALGRLFARANDAAFVTQAADAPREALAALGLALTRNVRVRIGADATGASLELQLCAAYHACLCATPELQPIVFANWKE